MARQSAAASDLELVGSRATDSGNLAAPGCFAWEILRRRGDYQAAPDLLARDTLIGACGAPLEILISSDPDPHWGLQFRGMPRALRSKRPPFLAPAL